MKLLSRRFYNEHASTTAYVDHKGKAFSSQRNNKDIFRKQNSRGMQRAKEVLSSNQANFHRNPRKSEINDSSTFEWLSVPIPNDIPASTMGSFLSQLTVVPTSSSLHFHVPMNATSTATGLTSLNDATIAHVSTMTATTLASPLLSTSCLSTPTWDPASPAASCGWTQQVATCLLSPGYPVTLLLDQV